MTDKEENKLAFKTADERFDFIKPHLLPHINFNDDEGELIIPRGFNENSILDIYRVKIRDKKTGKTYVVNDVVKTWFSNFKLDDGFENEVQRLQRLKERFDGQWHGFMVDRYKRNVYGKKESMGYFKFNISVEWL